MKSTGIVRKLDELGRITLPIELRRTLDIKEGDPLEIYVEEERIFFEKYNAVPTCKFCRSTKDVTTSVDGKVSICKECAHVVNNMYEE